MKKIIKQTFRSFQNEKFAKILQKMRSNKNITQAELSEIIYDLQIADLKKQCAEKGFCEDEISLYISEEDTGTLERRLKNKGLPEIPKAVAISTISDYETGKKSIPAWLMDYWERACKDRPQ